MTKMSKFILTKEAEHAHVLYIDRIEELQVRLTNEPEAEFEWGPYTVSVKGAKFKMFYDNKLKKIFGYEEDDDAMREQAEEHNAVLQEMTRANDKIIADISKEWEINREENADDASKLLELEQYYMPMLAKQKEDHETACSEYIRGKGDMFTIRQERVIVYQENKLLVELLDRLIQNAGL